MKNGVSGLQSQWPGNFGKIFVGYYLDCIFMSTQSTGIQVLQGKCLLAAQLIPVILYQFPV